MPVAPVFSVPLPRDSELAHAYFSEAIRHLKDARILHEADRYAAAITSTMKATELGLKSLLILYGIRGWHDLNKHNVMAVAKSISVLDSLLNALKSQYRTVVSDIEEMERLVPDKQTLLKLTLADAQNTEYPFFAEEPGLAHSYRLYLPEAYFDEVSSRKYFRTAFQLLTAIQSISPEVAAWGLSPGSSL